MGRKKFKIESEIKVETICVPKANMCHLDHVYLNLELFGEVQRSKLSHPIFPLRTDDKFYFSKDFWSPQNEKELHKLMRESPVSMELRHLPQGSKESILFAFMDTDSHKFLIEETECRIKGVLTAEKQIYLKQNKHNCGQLPCVKVQIRSTISSTETPKMDELLECDMNLCPHCDQFLLKKSHVASGGSHVRSHCDMYSCKCELHRSKDEDLFHCSVCHQDEPSSFCIREYGGKREEKYDENIEDFEEENMEGNTGKMRPPFVVRKVTSDLVGRRLDAFDSIYNGTMREQTQLRSSRKKKLHRLRSCSPKRNKSGRRSPSVKASEVCYACDLDGDKTRISCESCNLTSRGEPSYRCGDLVRPEPPMLRTSRETVDQRPLFPYTDFPCGRCVRKKVTPKEECKNDSLLMSSTRPIYKLDGYRDMEKYFLSHDRRQY